MSLTNIIQEIEKVQSHKRQVVFIIEKIEPILKSFDGKTISKRIATTVGKELEDYRVWFSQEYSWYSLQIWGNGIDMNDRIDITLGYKSQDKIFNFEWYVENNQRYYLDKSRYDKLEEQKSPEVLNELVETYERLKEEIEKFQEKVKKFEYPISSFFKL